MKAPHTDGNNRFVVQLLPVQHIAGVGSVQLQEACVRADEQAAVVVAGARCRRRKISCCTEVDVNQGAGSRSGVVCRHISRIKKHALLGAVTAGVLCKTHVLSGTPRQRNTPSRVPLLTRGVCTPGATHSWAERSSAGSPAPPVMAAGRHIPVYDEQRWQASSCMVK